MSIAEEGSRREAGAPRGRIVIEARGLRLGYGSKCILEDSDWSVSRGEFWFVLGPNGTGKSTLLKAVLGVIAPQGGSLSLSQDLGSGRRIGFVPQRCDIKATLPLTVAEFIRLGLTRTGIGRAEAQRNLAWALEVVGLADKAGHEYWSLSGGQRQRALVARGLVRRPDLLILDEPTSGLDLPVEESFLDLVARLNRELGITVIAVTHAIALAARFGSHVALFSRGRLRCGPKDEVLVGKNLREAYGVDVEVTYDAAGHAAVRVGCQGECR